MLALPFITIVFLTSRLLPALRRSHEARGNRRRSTRNLDRRREDRICDLGAVGALALGKVIAGFLYGVSASDPWVLTGVALLLGTAAAGAALIPAVRAARLSPMEALRQD